MFSYSFTYLPADSTLVFLPHCAVDPALFDQFIMATLFHDFAVVKYIDLICVSNGGKSVRYHDDRAVFGKLRKRFLHQHFIFGVGERSGFIENDNGSILQNRPRNSDTLAAALRRRDMYPRCQERC